MSNLICVECNGIVDIEDNVMLGEIVECFDCGVELEIVNLHPIRIELAPEVEEDWGE